MQNEKYIIKDLTFSLPNFLLSFVIVYLKGKKKKKRTATTTEINFIKILNLMFVHPIYIYRKRRIKNNWKTV